MNLKTTFVLCVLLGAGIGAWFWNKQRHTETTASETVTFLEKSLKEDAITRIEVLRGKDSRFVLERSDKEWSLPGKWPTRNLEITEWIGVLTKLHSRFAPIAIGKDAQLDRYGLADNTLTVKVSLGDVTRTLRFGAGAEPGESNRFSRPTYVRLDDKLEVIRLGPDVLASLDHNLQYFQQRRLFPYERVLPTEDAKDMVEQVIASEIEIQSASGRFAIVKKDKDWILKEAHEKKGKDWERICSEDRLDPSRVRTLLAALPDVWAARFIEKKDKTLDEMGLNDPDYVFTLRRKSEDKPSKLLVGKISERKERAAPTMPPPNPFQPPPKPPEATSEEYRYARLEGNEQLFEIKTDKLKDIAVPLEDIRDPQLAHFKTLDVKRLEIQHGAETLVFVKIKDNDKQKWRFEKPGTEDAEARQVEEILDKLSGLRASDRDVLDKADFKEHGLDKPHGQIKLTLEEGKDDKKTTRSISFALGTKEKEKDKLYVRVDGWARVNRVADEVWKLVIRPALAYRHRRILDIASEDVNKVEIQRADEKFTFEKPDKAWKLTAPVAADIDSAKVAELVTDLSKLEGVDLITETPKSEDLDKAYGLAKPKLMAILNTKDAKKPAQTLTIGAQREGKPEFYARLDQGPVFTLKKDVRDDVDRASLSYRSLQLLQLERDAVNEVTIQKDDAPPYSLKLQDKAWKLSGPFDAEVSGFEAEMIVEDLARLRADRFESHKEKELARFGLDKPALKVTINAKEKRVLVIGKKVSATDANVFARFEDAEAIFVLNEKTVAPLRRDAFDFLDKILLSVSARDIDRIRYQGAAPFTLQSKGEQWQVADSPAPTFSAEDEAADRALRPFLGLRATKYVAYGPKIDWAKYGLDKTASAVTITHKAEKEKKPIEHVLELGNEAEGGRYARVDRKDAVVLLDSKTADALSLTHLDFVDARVLKFDLDAITSIKRQMKDADIEMTKREDNWQLAKPATRDADNLTIGDLLEKSFRLKAKRIAAHPAKDVKSFGLDNPIAVVTLQTETAKHVIKVGDLARDAKRKDTDERFAIINDGNTVVVLGPELSRHLVAPVLYFADRNLASFSGVDTVVLERGARKATFNKSDAWQMTTPIKTDAEDAALEELIRGVQRLRADEIIADKAADLKKYGLDQPIAQWRFKTGENEKLHLIIGGLETTPPSPSGRGAGGEGARRYAKLGKQEQIFLLSSKLTAKVLDEYRSRKAWPALDAVQIEQLIVTGPDGSYTLRKKEAKWSVPGEDWTIKSTVVTDTLDALASLKALRYEEDTKADLQLYGLAKAAWKIEVQTPMGKRELWLGRTEGGSKRFYATTPGSDAVFVLDEDQGQRIARPVAAYVEADKKK